MKVAIGCDHAGFEFKEEIIKHFQNDEMVFEDFGTHSKDSVDYPDFAHPVSLAVAENKTAYGILICGTGNGVCITANKHQNVRAGLCWNEEIAGLIRMHNNANICCIPARYTEIDKAVKIVATFFNTEFEGGRHARRVDKICI